MLSAISAAEATRIGHGIHAHNEPVIMDDALENEITFEICVSSNVVLGSINPYAEHPFARLLHAGHKITLNTDDPVRLHTNIGSEYQLANYLGLNESELLSVTRPSLRS